MVGKTLTLPIVHRQIPIIADEYVEMDFGTGVVKITPAHDPNDFEVGLRHNLPVINVMTDDAKIVDDYPKYAGMDRYEARKAIVKDLEAEGALIKVEDYSHNVGTCYRCGTTVEPRVSKQWFVKMKPLAQPAIDAVKNGETKFVPSHFEKTYFHCLKISVTGVYYVSCGGDIRYLPFTAMTVANLLLPKMIKQYALNAENPCDKTLIHLIHGSVLHYGLSQHSAGLKRLLTSITSILQIHL